MDGARTRSQRDPRLAADPRLRELRRDRLVTRVLRAGDVLRRRARAARCSVGARHHDLRHRRCLRRRPQRELARRLAPSQGHRTCASASSSRRRRSTRWTRAPITGLSRARIQRQVETSLTRLGLERIPLYMAHDRDPGRAARGDAAGVRRSGAGREGRRRRRVQLRRGRARRGARDLAARGAGPLRVGAELVLAPRAG